MANLPIVYRFFICIFRQKVEVVIWEKFYNFFDQSTGEFLCNYMRISVF